MKTLALSAGCLLLVYQLTALSKDLENPLYRTPEERREAGLNRQITDWLSVTSLAEIEKRYQRNEFDNGSSTKAYTRPVSTFQLGFNAQLNRYINAELIFESEIDFEARKDNEDAHHGMLDEAILAFEMGAIGLSFGRQYVSFGEYYSHFITDPIIEFGETRRNAFSIDYEINDQFEITTYFFDSDIGKSGNNGIDWGAGLNFNSNSELLQLGIGYLSDLAESDMRFLRGQNNQYEQRVDALNAYALIQFDRYEISLETVKALRNFSELDQSVNQPHSTNLEFTFFPVNGSQLSLRIEHSKKLEDSPRWQYGIAGSTLLGSRTIFWAELLHGRFKNDSNPDEDEIVRKNQTILSFLLSIQL